MTAATALADCRTLGSNDYSYYRWNGKEGTFLMRTVAVTTNLVKRQKFWKEVSENSRPVIYQLVFPKVDGWKHKLPKRWHARIMPDGTVAARVDMKSFELVHETEFDADATRLVLCGEPPAVHLRFGGLACGRQAP